LIGNIRPIMLAEDSLPDAELAIDALRAAKLINPIVHLEDGVEVLDYLYRRGRFAGEDITDDPAVLLLDLKMPRLDGLDVLRQVRADPRWAKLPVVILTSSREDSDLALGWDLGANAYVVKPVDAGSFFSAVQTLGQFWAVINEAPPLGA
jgi:two-component system, response regulator